MNQTISRLASTLFWDVRVQFRQGLYYAALVVVLIWVAILWQLPEDVQNWLLPVALFMDMSVFGFYFMAGILFLEKGDGVLAALVVTPMRPGEYLAAKVLAVTFIALLASIAVVLFVAGWQVRWHWLLLGVTLNSWLMALLGFALAARYDTINEFLIPSGIWSLPTQLPLLAYLGLWTGWPIYLIPTQARMILFQASLFDVPIWELVYAVCYLVAASAVATWLATHTFERFVVRAEGTR
jgi:fluoroquinolone transport system permease protein